MKKYLLDTNYHYFSMNFHFSIPIRSNQIDRRREVSIFTFQFSLFNLPFGVPSSNAESDKERIRIG